ncbi:MAG: molybdopterin biosynthesis protein [Clostridiales bacterium]|nr:MAG: molybdopterin biosynthesis protein [Clostridiales bacterium]
MKYRASELPSIDEWLKEAKLDKDADKIGMYLTHNGVVRKTAKSFVRGTSKQEKLITSMEFSYDKEILIQIMDDSKKLKGIYYIKIWLNEGKLEVGDDLMYVLIGGDIRPNVTNALDYLVGRIKNECVIETEIV